MSKLGKKTIVLPKRLNYKSYSGNLLVSGPKGIKKFHLMKKYFHQKLMKKMNFKFFQKKKIKNISILWGTYRSLINNAVIGVTKGHEKNLELNGVGFRQV